MKFHKLLNVLTTVFAFILFFSCSSAEEPGNSGTPPPVTTVTSISLTVDNSTCLTGDTVFFQVQTNLGTTVTSDASFTVNGSNNSGFTYTPTSSGVYTVQATYNSIVSNDLLLTVNEPPTITSITMSTDPLNQQLQIGGVASFTVIANYSDGSTQDKTNECSLIINDGVVNGSSFLAESVGSFNIKASLTPQISNEIIIQVSNVDAPSVFTKKAIIEDYTGTWCGWCPRVSYGISLVEEQTDKVFSVGAHIGDFMENSYSNSLKDAFGVTGYPTAYVNRSAVWAYPEPNNVAQAVNQATGVANVGLSVGSILDGSTIKLLVSTGFNENVSGTKLVIFILEDGIIASQSNYTSYYGGGSNLNNFEHNHVLRYSITDVLGDNIDTSIGVKHLPFSVNLAANNFTTPTDDNPNPYSNAAVLAFLVDDSGKVVLNAQFSKVNESMLFD